ncbi:MarR family winged helix-turn-helix transcriptional regulator [Consotaella salsifontis]|uniref:DNA-binding transcriptional regulator, MarR family n=1 Tax=Consotaella salsifontis TaxID=1365950 RepID=A0A1T4LB00_9HYPH|nr:MarR family winged helix-turn-helix transcriptional regulator [Consotaella salsifontis]SJZ51761.1 DNA-binding transcriptional regulator, MarR family [Consotaella salsifontis]
MSLAPLPADHPLSQKGSVGALLSSRLERVTTILGRKAALVHRAYSSLTSPEFYVLLALGAAREDAPGVTSSAIVDMTAMDKTKVSRAVASLDERGWINRTRASFDRRFEFLALTEKGRTAYDAIESAARQAERDILDQLSEQELNCLEAGLAALDRVLAQS